MASFKVLETQFQMFINLQIYLNDEYIVMTRNYFLEYTRLDIPEFRDTLTQNMDYVKNSIEKRALHKREYDNRVNERLTQTTEEKVDSSKALDASLVDTESSGTKLKEQDTSSRSGMIHMLMMQISDPYIMKSQWLRHYKGNVRFYKTTRARQQEKTPTHTTSLIATNDKFKAQIQEKGFAVAALKNELRKLTGNSVNTKFTKPSILGKPVGQPLKNQSVVRQPTAFKSERPRISKPRFASQVDVNNDLSKPVTTHYLPKGRESAPAKPHHMIAPSSSRYSSNDIVHNHYLEEAKKKTHEHSRIPRNFSDSKHFVCSTCQKCVFNANHDACVIKFLKEVNSRAKVPSNKTTNRNKPVEQIRVATKPKRQIPKGHRFSIKKTTTVHEKTTSPRSCLRWQPTGRILKTVCLRWVPTGKTFASSTTKVESNLLKYRYIIQSYKGMTQSLVAKKKDISENRASRNFDLMIIKMTFEHSSSSLGRQCQMVSAENNTSGPVPQCSKRRLIAADQASVFMAMMSVHISSGLVLHQMTSDHNRSELGIQDHSNEPSSSKLVPKVVP
ncbi:hypothetical protein Tco_0569333 [Tanacetum coccineum]